MPSSDSNRPRKPLELLAVSFNFPPLAYPRSGQVARLLKHLSLSTTVLCADERGARRDPTLEPDAEARMRACLRVPFPAHGSRRLASRLAARLRLPVRGKIPDEYRSWGRPALKALRAFAAANDYRPDIVATFAQPMSDHLVGLKLKELYGAPWLAHFSDPWVGNPFDRRDALARRINLALERRVLERADLVVFTSEETVEMVMSKYPAAWKTKARVLPHSFEPSLYARRDSGTGEAIGGDGGTEETVGGAGEEGDGVKHEERGQIVVRYLGEFYGRRTPRPLVATLRAILADAPRLLEGVRFELVGPVSEGAREEAAIESLPEGLVVTRPPVSYRESLRLATEADGLIIIDAPAARSVFLPSKLVDYLGAARPILGLTPPGASANLISELGGWAADPSDSAAMRRATEEFLSFLSGARAARSRPWGDPRVRARYEARAVAESFAEMLRELVS
jgi:glycosyltransferase involved in cell wall biosynthesis